MTHKSVTKTLLAVFLAIEMTLQNTVFLFISALPAPPPVYAAEESPPQATAADPPEAFSGPTPATDPLDTPLLDINNIFPSTQSAQPKSPETIPEDKIDVPPEERPETQQTTPASPLQEKHDFTNSIRRHKFDIADDTLTADQSTLTLTFQEPESRDIQIVLTDPDRATSNITDQILGATAGPLGTSIAIEVPTSALQKPGEYQLTLTDAAGNYDTQTFSWGVLALNWQQNTYHIGDTAQFAIAVLDNAGEMVCDAAVRMTLTNGESGTTDTLTTDDGSIRIHKEVCSSKQFSLDPDYSTSYTVRSAGTYTVTLEATTSQGSHSITETFTVDTPTPFAVTRTAATRIYPILKYPVVLKVVPQNDFTGVIQESVPSSFDIEFPDSSALETQWHLSYPLASTQATVTPKDAGRQTIEWNVAWSAGQTYYLAYAYNAPDISPALYMTGPMRAVPSQGDSYTEPRQWQIASDSTLTYIGSVETAATASTTGNGWVEVVDAYGNDTRDSNMSVAYKLMGATPDSSVPVKAAINSGYGSASVVHVWRNVSQTTPMDVTATSTSGTNGALCDSPSISPTTSGAVVLSACLSTAGISAGDTTITAPTGYGNQADINGNGTTLSMQVGIASKAWTSGAENPAAWTNITTSTSDAWSAASIAIRPSGGTLTYVGTAENSGTAPYSVNISGLSLQQGDLVVVVTGWVYTNDGDPGVNYYDVSLSSLSPQEGDLAIVSTGWSSATNGDPGVITSGYTEVADLYADDTRDANLSVDWKLMGSTPDTIISIVGPGYDTGNYGAVTEVHLWRGADQSTPLDTTTTTATAANSALWDSPSITPVTAGAHVLSIGLSTAAASAGDTSITAPTGYTNQADHNANGLNMSVQTGIASKAWSSGAENPAAWTNITTSTSDGYAAATVAIHPATTMITVSGTANGNSGATVKIAINTSVQSQVAYIVSGVWSFGNITTPSAGDVITVWVDNVADANESTAVTKFSAGDVTGLTLNTNVLSIGSSEDTSLSVTNLDSYDCTGDEDIMHQAGSSHLKVEGDSCAGSTTNSYSAEKIEILSGDTLTIGTSETMTTYDLTITGTLTSSGSSTYNVSHDWANAGTFTASTSTVNFTGADSSTQTVTGSTSFNNLSISTASNGAGRTVTFTAGTTQTVTGTWTVTGYSGKVITLQSSAASVWTINPTTASVTYVSVSYSTNSNATPVCATYSTDGGNNTAWNIGTGSTCVAVDHPTSSSFQRKTWWDGTRYWRSSQDTTNNRIMFEYSTTGSSWTEDTSARIAADTPDYSVWADSGSAYIAYATDGTATTDSIVSSSNLIAHYKMDEASWNGTSGEVLDASTNSLNGTAVGNATTAAGKMGNGGTFDGTGDYATVSDPGTNSALDFSNGENISMSAWVYIPTAMSAGEFRTVLSKGSTAGTDNTNYSLAITNRTGNDVISFCYYSAAYHCYYTSTDVIVTNTWQHIALTYTFGTGSTMKIYYNNSLQSGSWAAGGSSAPTESNDPLWIGGADYPGGGSVEEAFVGTLDDVRIYNRELTTTEIAALSAPGYDIEVRKASSYPGTSFSWSNPTVALNGSSATIVYTYPTITQDSAGKVWLGATYRNGSTYDSYAVRSTTANVITDWDTATSLDSSASSNRYTVVVPRTSSAIYAIWMDGADIQGKNYNGTSWDVSPTSIDTGVADITKSFSAVADNSGNVYLTYVEDLATDQISHTKWNGTSWTTPVMVPDAAGANDAYPTLSLDTAGTDLYAFWIDTGTGYIAYSTCDISTNCDSAAEWDPETAWTSTADNEYVSSNYSGSTKIFAQWAHTGALQWDKLTITLTVNLSGTVYTDEGSSAIGINKTVNVRIDGAGTYTDETDGSGVWAINSLPVTGGQIVTMYLDNETEEGTTVVVSDGSSQSNFNIYQNRVILRSDTGTITPDNMYIADDGDDDVKYSVSAGTNGNVTIDTGFELHVWTGDTFDASGGTITTQGSSNIHVDDAATLTLDTSGNTIAGDLVVDDTALANINNSTTISGGDITVSSGGDIASTGGTVTMGASGTVGGGSTGSTVQLTNLTVSSGTTTLGSDADNIIVVNGDIAISSGATLAMNGKTADVNGGNVTTTGTGSITCSGCAAGGITLSGDGSTNGLGGGSGSITLYALTLDGATNTTAIGTSSVTIIDDVTIGSGRTLTGASAGTLYVGDDWSNSGTFTASTSTVNLNGGGGTTQTMTGATTFYGLVATGSSARTVQFASSATTTITDVLTLTGASGQLLTLGPSTAATTWNINPPATSTISYVSVSYSASTECLPATNSSGTNYTLWDFESDGCPVNTQIIDHEEGNFSDWTSTATDGGDLSVTSGAALAGTNYGMSALIDDTNVIYGVKDIGATSTTGVARARFYVDPNSIVLDDLEQVSLLFLIKSDAVTNFANIKLIKISGSLYLRGTMIDDNGTHQETAAFAITDAPHYIEFRVTRASGASANDATFETWLDGVAQTTMTGVDSYTRFADFRYVGMGALGFSGTFTGTIYLDELEFNDDGSYIGPVGGGNTAPNNPGSLAQKTTSDVTLATGDWHNTTSIKFTATADDTDGSDTLYLCVEKDQLGTSFSNTEDSCGSGVSYTGSPVTVTVTIASQTDALEYHWQARVKDAAGAYSSWVAYGGNAESARDYGLDTTAPTGGTVYDGTSAGVDSSLSTTSLTTLSANWDSFNNNVSGINKYQYSIGTTAGATDVKSWTDNGTTTSVTDTSLSLQTSNMYYVNVRAVDNAGNTGGTVSSNGQRVAPSLSFSVSPSTITFAALNAANSYTDAQTTTLTTSTNAYNGYIVRAFVADYLRSTDTVSTIPDFDGGTYASPDVWGGSDTGYGYTSSDTTIQGSDKFAGATLYAPFTHSGPGDIIADHTSTVTGTAISNEQFTITHKVRATNIQPAKKYTTTVIYTITAQY